MTIERTDRETNIIGNNVRALNFYDDARTLRASIYLDQYGRLNLGDAVINVGGSNGSGSGPGASVTHHHELQGLSDDDHAQYVHRSVARTVSARHTFNPAAAASPFVLGANAQGQTVVGLRADELAKTLTAGDGLTGGGALTADRSLTLGTPSTLGVGSTNGVTATSHTHAIATSSAVTTATSVILATDANGYLRIRRIGLGTAPSMALHLLQGSTPQARIAYDGGNYADLAVSSGGTLTLAPTGDIELDPAGNDVLPANNYDINLGMLSRKYLTLHAAELWVETLVAQETIATIGGRILVGPTTKLIADLGAGATTIDVEHNQMVSGDRVYMEAAGKVEFMAVTSGPTAITGGYRYSVTRNLDGTGANEWFAGDAVFNTGTTGDGFIDLYSVQGVHSGGWGPTIVGNYRYGTAFNAWRPAWAIGNLNGLYGYGANTYGVGLGHYGAGNYLTVDAGAGLRFFDSGGTLRAQLNSSTWTLGDTNAENVQITTTAVNIRDGGTTLTSIAGGDVTVGRVANNHTRVVINAASGFRIIHRNGSGVDAMKIQFDASGNGTLAGSLSVTGSISAANSLVIDSDGLRIAAGALSQNKVIWTTGLPGGELGLIWVNPGDGNNFVVEAVNNLTLDAAFEVSTTTPLSVGGYVSASGNVDASSSVRAAGGLIAGSTSLTTTAGNVLYTSNLLARRGGVNYSGYVFVPLSDAVQSSTFNGGTRGTGYNGTYVASSQFSGVPSAAVALAIKLTIIDESTGANVYVARDSGEPGAVQCVTAVANQYFSSSGIVALDGSGRFYFSTSTTISEVYIQCFGYFI